MRKKQIQTSLEKVKNGFQSLSVGEKYKKTAQENIKHWLEDDLFQEYWDQLNYLIDNGKFELLLDSFYQVIPFGTGGRRGPVGIGPNRINSWTIQASAQGHSDFLLKQYGEKARTKGIVLCFDVRKYPETNIYSKDLPCPVFGITSKDLTLCAVQVYAANSIKCYLLENFSSTPELSFSIRYLDAIAGDVFSASHNPKEDNGKKVFSSDGGQLIPPEDQNLSDAVNGVEEIKTITIEEAKAQNLLVENISKRVNDAFVSQISRQSILKDFIDPKNIKIVYSPLHGVGCTSVYRGLKENEFDTVLDDLTSTPDGFFPNVKFNIPNPEVVESMETLVAKGKEIDADILINSDPDADRLGLMARIDGKYDSSRYKYFNGNEIGIILTHFVLSERKAQNKLPEKGILAKTIVTSELIAKIAEHYGLEVIGDLLVGFKYIGEVIKKLEEKQELHRFVLGMEESHGFLVGSYCRDKDAAGAALLLAELGSQLKAKNKNIPDYLDNIYKSFGYHCNKQTSLIFLGVEGKEKIDNISSSLRKDPPQKIGKYKVKTFVDRWKGPAIVSATDKSSRNVLSFFIEPVEDVAFIKITVRPSGTEPKIKIYLEVGGKPINGNGKLSLHKNQEKINRLTITILDEFTRLAYNCVGISMPDHGFRLSNLLPVEVKLKYFEVENELLQLEKKLSSKELTREEVSDKISELLIIFGKDPIEKISGAFQEKTGLSLRKFIEQKLVISSKL